MASTEITIPDFNFSVFYYPQILEELIQYKRRNVPEHTDESEYDPLIQFLRASALVGHLNNVNIDLVANEVFLPTAHLAESVRNALRLIDYELATATPAVGGILFELSKVFTTSFELINAGALVATERSADADPIYFENQTVLSIDRTDQMSYCYAEESASFTDYTTEGNSQTTPADDFQPWAALPSAKDSIYFGHKHIMWDQLNVYLTSPVEGTRATGEIDADVAPGNYNDGETFVLNDGVNPAVTFHFNVTGTYIPGGGYDDENIEVDISGAADKSAVGVIIRSAINGAPTLDITATAAASLWITDLENDTGGTVGNESISETVSNGGFVVTGMSGGVDGELVGVWEYYDGDFAKVAPTTVNNYAPGQLLVDCTSLLGTEERTGTVVRVQLDSTTAYEDVEVQWNGSINYIITSTWLGQTSPSTDEDDYSIGSAWSEIPDSSDGTVELTSSGVVSFRLPQSVTENWIKGEVDGVEAYWIRFRVISAADIELPVLQYVQIDQGNQYVIHDFAQGRTNLEDTLGSSDGSANQRFITSKDYFISGTMEVQVDGEVWTEVENFLSSLPTDKHYTIELGEDDRATVVFGDGQAGKVPPVGVNNISAEYRYGAEEDGNVGANTIIVNKSGLTYINSLTNPRQASGWDAGDAADEESLERAKIAGPASLRTRDVALGPDDVLYLMSHYTDSSGARPFSRGRVIEEGFGPKTMELVVVTKGGGQASSVQLADLDEYFNGDFYAHPPVAKKVVSNQQVTSVNFSEKTIDVVATVYGSITKEAIETRLSQILQPEALKADGVTWEWDFGGEVPVSRISHEIFETAETITKVKVTTPASDTVLAARELPKLGSVTITVVS